MAITERSDLRLLEVLHDLADAEQAHGDADEADAVRQRVETHRVAQLSGVDVGADDAEQKAQHDHGDGLDGGTAGQNDGGDEAEHHERAIIRRPELLREARQRGAEQRDHQRCDASGEKRTERRDRER